MNTKKAAWVEAFTDTALGTVINFPLNVLAMWVIFRLKLTVIQSSVLLWLIFTTIAVVRKYYLRLYFEKKSKTIVDSEQ